MKLRKQGERVTVGKVGKLDRPQAEATRAAGPAPPPTAGAPAPSGRQHVEVQRLAFAEPVSVVGQDAPASGLTAPAPSTPGRQQDAVTGVEKGGSAERRDWVGQLLDELWPYARDAVQKLAWETIPQQLEASRPAFVYSLDMERFTLGEAQPCVRDIRVHRGDASGIEELFIECEAEWHSQQDIQLHITVPRLPVAVAEVTPDPLEEALRLMLQLRVSLRDAWIRAGVRVSLRPLLRRIPVVGAVQVGLTRLPAFGYELDLSLASAALAPLIKEWLDEAIRDMVLQPWVLPEHYFYPLEPGMADVERPAGVLSVRVVEAQDVPKPGLLSSARPMVEVFLRAAQRRQTHVASTAGGHATWGSQFEFPVSVPEHQELTAVLYDYSDWTPNDELGRASLALRELEPGRQQEVVLRMRAGAEEHHDEEQQKQGGANRVALALARPFTKKGSAVCKLKLQVTFIPLSEQESQLVVHQRYGSNVAAGPPPEAPAAVPGGVQGQQAAGVAQLHPLVLRMLHSGMLLVNVQHGEGLLQGRQGTLFKPYFKTVVRVGSLEAESDATRANRQGEVEFSVPVALHLPPEAVEDQAAQVEIKLVEHGWMGSSSCGSVDLPLHDLVVGNRAQGQWHLRGGSGCVTLTAEYKPYF